MTIREYAEELANLLDSYEQLGLGRPQISITLAALTVYFQDGGVATAQVQRRQLEPTNGDDPQMEPLAVAVERAIDEVIEQARPRHAVLLRYRIQVDSHGGAMIET